MKYIVVECHAGYAVLMDENAVFVRSANLGYEVGQTVENPVLEEKPRRQGRNIVLYRVLAAAACLVLVSGIFYYRTNVSVYSEIIISASADICLQVNRKGEVLTAESMNDDGLKLLKDYQAEGKDRITAAEEIVRKAVSMGCISDGDTVSLYIDTPENDYTSYKEEIEEHFRADRKIKVDVKKYNHSEKPWKSEKHEKNREEMPPVTATAEKQPEIFVPEENQNSPEIVSPEIPENEVSPEAEQEQTENVTEEPANETVTEFSRQNDFNENFSDNNKNNYWNNRNFSDSDKNNYENSYENNYDDDSSENSWERNRNYNYDDENDNDWNYSGNHSRFH